MVLDHFLMKSIENIWFQTTFGSPCLPAYKESSPKELSQRGLSSLGSPGTGFLKEIIDFNKESFPRAPTGRGHFLIFLISRILGKLGKLGQSQENQWFSQFSTFEPHRIKFQLRGSSISGNDPCKNHNISRPCFKNTTLLPCVFCNLSKTQCFCYVFFANC